MVQSCTASRSLRRRPPTNLVEPLSSVSPFPAACDQMLQVETHDNLCGKLLLTPG